MGVYGSVQVIVPNNDISMKIPHLGQVIYNKIRNFGTPRHAAGTKKMK